MTMMVSQSGKAVVSKMDEFLENSQTAFDPPPRPFFGKNVAIFSEIYDKSVAPAQNLQRNFLDRNQLKISTTEKNCNQLF